MPMFKYLLLFSCVAVHVAVKAQSTKKFKGQGPITGVSTESRPVQKQWKGIFSFPRGGVYFSNDFKGGRLNGLSRVNDTSYTALITSENTPINGSPWYAFKVWSAKPVAINLKLTYQQGVKHRYAPKITKNGQEWVSADTKGSPDLEPDSLPVDYQFTLQVGPDTTWVAAQELNTSTDMDAWTKSLQQKPFITAETIGKSSLGKDMTLLKIGNPKSKNRILIIGRQHPPEVTGQMALHAFIEDLVADHPLAKKFREQFLIYVVPLMNPDGVDEGFWRNNAGGIDLNRDWSAFHQPESAAVRDYLAAELADQRNKLWFSIDFHSTHDDIYYVVDPKLKGLAPGFIQDWLGQLKDRIPGYNPNIKALYSGGPTYTAFSYLFQTYGTEALVYEIGDKTPREFIEKKGKVSADLLMEMLLKKKIK